MHRNLVRKKQRSDMTCGTQTHNQKRSWMTSKKVISRVLDPHCFNADSDTDPDPAFFLIADPDPGFDDLN